MRLSGTSIPRLPARGTQPVLDAFHQFPVRSHVHHPVHGLRSGVCDSVVYLGTHRELDVGILRHGVRHFMGAFRPPVFTCQ